MEKHPQSYHILLLKHTSMFYTRKCKEDGKRYSMQMEINRNLE